MPLRGLVGAGHLDDRRGGGVQVTALREGDMSTTVETTTDIRPFQIEVAQEDLDDLRRRIAETRWPSKELVADRSQGVQLKTLKELARYWANDYDWRQVEAKLNSIPQFTTEIDGVDVH